jgi:two-component system OmpR family sensor kinase
MAAPRPGRLGTAFNDMLDQRDAAEHRLRQFVADASHELRTPLTSIRGYVDLTLDGGFGEHQRDDVMRRIRAESRRMHDLVEDLLLLASLDQGRPLRTDPVDLVAVATDAASDANAMAPQRTIDVDCTRASAVVIGDDMRLRQVVAGLVQNAIDHTPADARITLAVCSTGDAVELSVADDGPGMSADAAARVFDRFARGDPSRSRPGGGAGLGLAIATSIVHAHGGTLTLDTSEGQGSTFTVRIPCAPS